MKNAVELVKPSRHWIWVLWLCVLSNGCGHEPAAEDTADSGPVQDDGQSSLNETQGSDSLTPKLGCAEVMTAPLKSAPHGLVTAQRLDLPIEPPMGAGHLADFVVFEDRIYVANSFDGVATFERTNQGKLKVLNAQVPGSLRPRCNSLAIHETSRTLFCASPDNLGSAMMGLNNPDPMISSFRLSSLGVPSVHKAPALSAPHLYARSLLVVGDKLYIPLFDQGLWHADIAENGDLSNLSDSGLIADFRHLQPYGDKLVALTDDRGLLLMERNTESALWFVVQEWPLNGPSLGLTVAGDSALVSMGSAGLNIFDLSQEKLSLVHSLHPPAVVVTADQHEQSLAVISLSGLYLYDLNQSPPAIIGTQRTKRVMLWGRFFHGDLVVSDWEYMTRYSINVAGRVFTPDAAQGYFLAPGQPALMKLRNPGSFALRILGVIQETGLFQVELAPGEEKVVTLSPEILEEYVHPLWLEADLVLHSCPATTDDFSLDGYTVARSETPVLILQRDPSENPQNGHPGQGDVFPIVGLATEEAGDIQIPVSEQHELVVFYEHDCAAMWPQLEDLAWLHEQDLVPLRANPMLISIVESNRNNFLDRWNLWGLRHGYTGGHVGIEISDEVHDMNIKFGSLVYDDGFMGALPGGAKHPTDYLVDETGKVLSVQRIYMGQFAY